MRIRASDYTPLGEPVDEVPLDLIRLWVARATRLPPIAPWFNGAQDLPESEPSIRKVHRFLGGPIEENAKAIDQMISALENREDLERGIIFENLRMLGRSLGLSAADLRILGFRIILRLSDALSTVMTELLRGWTDVALHNRLAFVLGLPLAVVERALDSDGALVTSRLLLISPALTDSLYEKTGLSAGLINAFVKRHRSARGLMSFLLDPSTAGRLTISDYPHLAREVTLTLEYLRAAAARRRKGVNVLLHGPPGTGKTELPKAICRELGWKLYDVKTSANNETLPTRAGSLDALVTVQRVLKRARRTAVLFDEVEESIGSSVDRQAESIHVKQFLNHFLESVSVPTFWITNHPDRICPAFMRRFDIVIAVDDPPRNVKRRVLLEALQGVNLPNPSWLDNQAQLNGLTPALITRLADVSRLAAKTGNVQFEDAFDTLRNQHFRAHGRTPFLHAPCAHLDHDFHAVNASIDLHELTASMRRVRNARLLFHGAPGTGKTAFAHALAEAIDRQLQVKHASDLLSPYLGSTEQNIRKAFFDATTNDSILLIDEADSFLQSRSGANRSWEITQVNEFLTQLERFEGLLICTTNLMTNLDNAASRRFDAKIEFMPLRPHQALRLFKELSRRCGLESIPSDHNLLERLSKLPALTPGDFATVARFSRLSQLRCIDRLFAALTEEQRYKPEPRRNPLGFIKDDLKYLHW